MGGGISQAIAVNGQPIGPEELHLNNVAPRYFETMRTPVVLGREFTTRDDASAPGVAMVNEAFVRRYMPDGSALGQRLSVVGLAGDAQIVGVVRDAVYETLRQAPPPTVYMPYLQRGAGGVTFEIYAAGAIAQVASAVRAAVQPKVPATPLSIRTLTAQLESSLVQERLMRAGRAFGALALVAWLASDSTGSCHTPGGAHQRDRHPRGAGRTADSRAVARDAGRLQMLAVGVAVGLPVAWAASRLISSMLFDVRPMDPLTIAGAIADPDPGWGPGRVPPCAPRGTRRSDVALRHD